LTIIQELTDIKKQSQSLPGKDVEMDPLAEFTKLECWDENGKPFLKEVSPVRTESIACHSARKN